MIDYVAVLFLLESFFWKKTTLLKSIDFHQGLESADVAAMTCLHLRNAFRASTTPVLEAPRTVRSVPLEWPPRGMDRHIASIAISDIEPMEMETWVARSFLEVPNSFFQLRQLMNYKKNHTGIVGKVI